MTRKTKISILIITIYFISFFLFELFIGTARTLGYMEECVELERFNVLAPLVTLVEAGIWHFICVLIVAIICRFIKQIDESYKHIIYYFPMITFIFSIPVGLMATYFAKFFRMVWTLENKKNIGENAMERVKLVETKIENLRNFNWIEYFKYNNMHLLKLDFNNDAELSKEEIELITPSIKAFQIGEGSEGKHLSKVVEKFAMKNNYKEYQEIMKWFIAEENRHSQTLKKYMEIYRIKPVQKLWIDNIFRLLRKLMGLECEVIVLVTAEMISLSYYTALANATNSNLLKTICKQMLNDELKHVVLQSDTLYRISKNRNKNINKLIRAIRKLVMHCTVFVVWHKYKKLFIKGDYEYKKFKTHSIEYLNESIQIEKIGQLEDFTQK